MNLVDAAKAFPSFSLQIKNIETHIDPTGAEPVEVTLEISCSATAKEPLRSGKKKAFNYGPTSILTLTSDLDFVDFRRIGFALLHVFRSLLD